MIDNKGRLFGKINIVDMCVVLLLVVALFTTAYKFGFSAHKDVNEAGVRIEYVLKAKALRNFTVDSIEIGDKIYDDENNKFLGVITAVEAKPAWDYVLKSDGTYEYAQKPERYDAYITVESDARVIDGGYFANGNKEIGMFSNIDVYSQKFYCQTEVQSVGEIK